MNRRVLDKALDKLKSPKIGGYRENCQYWIYNGKNAERLVAEVLGALGL